MFTGIIEEIGKVIGTNRVNGNLEILISCSFLSELKVDQSIAHNGVCLTVTEIDLAKGYYKVVAVEETLQVSNFKDLTSGQLINLERSLMLGDRLDGHIVQGHVDARSRCLNRESLNGSWVFRFEIPKESERLLVKKGSICVNGVSLTIAHLDESFFEVAIIPYTYDHTSFQALKAGDVVNLEFDILGKYLDRQYFLLSQQFVQQSN